MLGVISLVLSHCSKNFEQWMNQCYSTVLFGKQRKIYGLGVRVGRPKRLEERPEAQFWLLFLFFLLSLSLPSVNRASQEGCLFQLRFSLQSSDLPLFYFCRRFPSLSFSHHFQSFLNSFFLFYLPNISPPTKRWEAQVFGKMVIKVSLDTSY